MEDGLLIAKLTTENPEARYKLLDEKLPWNIIGDKERIKNHKIKMVRKNIVLKKFINIKGYSIDALVKAGKE